MSDSIHLSVPRLFRCRRNCPNRTPYHLAFGYCDTCWAATPMAVQAVVGESWSRVENDPAAVVAHVELLVDIEEALDGCRQWGTIIEGRNRACLN